MEVVSSFINLFIFFQYTTKIPPLLSQHHSSALPLICRNNCTFRSTRGCEDKAILAALHWLSDFGHATVAPGEEKICTFGNLQIYHGSKTNWQSFMVISETLRMAAREDTQGECKETIRRKHTFFLTLQKHRNILPSEHGGIPWRIAASLLDVHRVLLMALALPAQHVTPTGGLSTL